MFVDSGRQRDASGGLVDEDVEQFCCIDALGGQAEAKDVVGVRHDLDRGAFEVAVRNAGAGEQCLAGFEVYQAKEERCCDQGVVRVVCGDADDPVHRFPAVSVALGRGTMGCIDSVGGEVGSRVAA